jgi:Zn-dependent protease
MNDMILKAAILIVPLVVAIVFHEVAHGYVARLLGDKTASELGRLSLNPIRHIDPFGTIILPGFLALVGVPVLGWAKPVPVLQQRLRNPRYGMMAVAAAGPASNIVLATIGAVVLGLVAGSGMVDEATLAGKFIIGGLSSFLMINVFVAVFNMLPIPPFDGSHVVEGLLPRSAVPAWRKFGRYGMLPIIALIVVVPALIPGFDPVGAIVMPPFEWLFRQFVTLASLVSGG